jgi:hypothetical protein
MKKVHEFDDVVLFSSKEVAKTEGPFTWFVDGSVADLQSCSCVNRGVGDIRFAFLQDYELANGAAPLTFGYESRERLVLEGGDMYFDVYASGVPQTRVVLIGTAQFQQDTRVRDLEEGISIETAHTRMSTTTFVNGRRVGEPVEGRVEIYLPRCSSLALNCSGAGIGRVQLPITNLDVEIRGSMSLNCEEVDRAKVDIHGSGHVRIQRVQSACDVDISGSGEVEVSSGEFPVLGARVRGSGAIIAGVSVRKATLEQTGSGSILVANVIEESSEIHGGAGRIIVLKRGA